MHLSLNHTRYGYFLPINQQQSGWNWTFSQNGFQEKMNWVMIGRQYVVDWVTLLVPGTYYHYILLILLLVMSLWWHPQSIKLVDWAYEETVITVTASSILRPSLAPNNRNMLAFVNVDVDVDAGAGAADTRRMPM
jgi:hypothetical protein